jgi:hypothetical protein
MAKKKTTTASGSAPKKLEYDDPDSVEAFMDALKHPLKPVVEAVRKTVLAADKSITEGIKWNSPSFYRHGWFATVNVRPNHGVLVVLHHGAKARSDADLGATLQDPSNLLQWLGKDRATVAFTDDADFQKKQSAFTKIIRQWAKYQAALADST